MLNQNPTVPWRSFTGLSPAESRIRGPPPAPGESSAGISIRNCEIAFFVRTRTWRNWRSRPAKSGGEALAPGLPAKLAAGQGRDIIQFIIITIFIVLNLFIGIIVKAMQEEHAKARAEEFEAERELIQDETEVLKAEMSSLRLALERSRPPV